MFAPPGPGAEIRDRQLAMQEKNTGMALHDAPLPEATVKTAEEESLNFSSILKGTAANRMNLYEKKAALINA